MVRAWIADIRPLCEEECYRKYYEQLPDFRKKKADALRSAQGRAQSVGVWSLLEKIRAEESLPESSAYNLSHSGDYVMCAVELDGKKEQVGCDLERIGRLRLDLAVHFFCREEYEAVLECETEEGRTDCFFRYWVLKESFIKATGRGMALPLNSFCVRLGEPPVLIRQPEEYPDRYYYREFSVQDIPYKMAVCSTDKEIDSKIHTGLRLL